MIVVGIALGVVASLIASNPAISFYDIPILVTGALFLMPTGLLVGGEAFAINNPLWSLFFEMVAGLIYGSNAHRKTEFWHEVVLLAILAAALFHAIKLEGTVSPIGFASWQAFLEGLFRVAFSFFAGVLIFRWNIPYLLGKVSSKLPLLILLLVLFFPLTISPIIFDYVCVTIMIPIVVALAAAVPLTEDRPFALDLGQLSYPLYIVHQPIIRLGAQFHSMSNGVIPLPITVAVTLLISVALANFLFVHVDKPARRYMARAFSAD